MRATAAALLAAAILGMLFASPIASAQVPDLIPMARLESQDGHAVLFFSPKTNEFSVTWALKPGPDPSADICCQRGYSITTSVWDEDGWLGCFNTADGTAASGNQAGLITGSAKLTPLECTENDPALEDSLRNPGQNVGWSFTGRFVSTGRDDSAENKFWGTVIGAVVGGLVLAGYLLLCAGATASTAGAAGVLCVGSAAIVIRVAIPVVSTVAGAVTGYLTSCDGSECQRIAETTVLNDAKTVRGGPSLRVSLCPLADGSDTWDPIETNLYNQEPGSTIGSSDPYDSGVNCIDVKSLGAVKGVRGTVKSPADKVITRPWQGHPEIVPDPLDPGNLYDKPRAIDPFTVAFHGLATSEVTAPLAGYFNFDVVQAWDYEWAGEPTKRLAEFGLHYQDETYFASDGSSPRPLATPETRGNSFAVKWYGVLEMNGQDSNEADCASGATLGLKESGQSGFGAAPIQAMETNKCIGSSPFTGTNVITGEAIAAGVLRETTETDIDMVEVTFDIVPKNGCVAGCAGLGGYTDFVWRVPTDGDARQLENSLRTFYGPTFGSDLTVIFAYQPRILGQTPSAAFDWQDYAAAAHIKTLWPSDPKPMPRVPVLTILVDQPA